MSEIALQKRILLALHKQGIVHVIRNNVGVAVPLSGNRPVRYGLGTGSPDLVGIVRGSGRAVGFEIKTPTGRVRKEQTAWIALFNKLGGYGCIVRSIDEALAEAEYAATGRRVAYTVPKKA